MSQAKAQAALLRLDELTRRLRKECPWDREQDERSIVSHTVEEAYELADAAHKGDDAALLDELGDVLFQVHFLSLLMEERGAGDLASVAEHCREKLIRRHPHVFGEVEVADSAEVRRNWDEIKRTQEGRGSGGLFGDVPENLPALSYARKTQRRAAEGGFDYEDSAAALSGLHEELEELERAGTREEIFAELGDLLFAAVNVARKLDADPELALRRSAERFGARVQRAQQSAAGAGEDWPRLSAQRRLEHYEGAKK